MNKKEIYQEISFFYSGRTDINKTDFFELLKTYLEYVEMITITFHHTEGTNLGIPFEQVRKIKEFINQNQTTPTKLVVAGGINSAKELSQLIKLQVIPQFGSGFWNGSFTLGDAFLSLLNTQKQSEWIVNNNDQELYPTIVQSVDGIILGLVYCTAESLKISADTRVATFYSRDSGSVWIKGATSGNYHTVKEIHMNCDNTAIRMIVQGDTFCHLGCVSCFGHTDPSRSNLKSLQKIIQKKRKNDGTSYTTDLLKSATKIKSKILEESNELVCSIGESEIIHESADLLYFVMMFLQKHDIDVRDIEQELIKRHYVVLKPEAFKPHTDAKLRIGIVNNASSSTERFLENIFNTEIKKVATENNVRNYEYTTLNPNLSIIQIKPKDIPVLINNNFIDGIVTYEDIIITGILMNYGTLYLNYFFCFFRLFIFYL